LEIWSAKNPNPRSKFNSIFCTSKHDLKLGAILWFQQEFPCTSKQRNWKWRSFPFHLRFGIFSSIHFRAKIPTSKQTLSEVLLEYFSTIGDRLIEFACLFYCLDKLFWCMLALLQLPIAVSYICLSQYHFLWGLLKIFRNGGEWISTHSTRIRSAWSHESPPWRGSFPLNLSMLRIHECCWDSARLPNSNL
jgi:hypothetical protein